MKECCATCRHYEDWSDYEGKDDGVFGICELEGEEVDYDPQDLTCFEWEAKEEDDE